MQSLADIQANLRDAVVAGNFAPITPFLFGGLAAEHRLAIHHRHYHASLVAALLEKFPGTTWLVGSEFMIQAARNFVSACPPAKPCIAEYGEKLPGYLAQCAGADRVPYVPAFAELEWHVGHVAIAVHETPIAIQELSGVSAETLWDARLITQSGARYLEASWPLDELMKIYLAQIRPERFVFQPAEVWLEIVGARGEFRINRIPQADFVFRKSISEGQTIGDAAETALATNSTFDPGAALVSFVADGLATALGTI